MKNNYLLYLFFFFTITVNAQWDPFPLGQKSFYENQHTSITYQQLRDTTISIYYHDSIINYGSHQVLHFDYSTPGYNGCYQPINNDPDVIKFNIEPFRPDSIISKNDTLLLAYTYENFPLSTDSILFLPNTAKDSSWYSAIDNVNYTQLKFTCDSIYLDTIFGNIIDSVKTFSIKAYNNSNFVSSDFDTLTIILSKNYGFKQLVSFHQNIETSILGINSLTAQQGFQNPSFSDYFHLNVGDVIIWKNDFHSFDVMNPGYISYFKDSLINAINTNDSAIYNFTRTDQNGNQTNRGYRFFKNELAALSISTSIFCTSNTINAGYNTSGSGELYETFPVYITQDSIVNRIYGSYGYYDINCNADITIDSWSSIHYNTYYGLTSYSNGGGFGGTNTWTIEGAIINGVQTGNFWSVGINELAINYSFSIYPNPSTENHFTLSGKNIESVQVYNAQGVIIKTVKILALETDIDLKNQPKGLYFVKSKFKNGSLLTKRLLLLR